MNTTLENVRRELKAKNFPPEQVQAVMSSLESVVRPRTYQTAVLFLGVIALVLAVGAVVLLALDKELSDALWGALGASIGGLAGIFMQRE